MMIDAKIGIAALVLGISLVLVAVLVLPYHGNVTVRTLAAAQEGQPCLDKYAGEYPAGPQAGTPSDENYAVEYLPLGVDS
jgi:hypothetical protein